MFRRFRLLVLTLAAATAVLRAQQPQTAQPPPEQRPVFRGGANLVRVDVSVVNHRGQPITDLRKEDFEVREDNIPQTVQTLKLIESTGAAPEDDTSLAIRSREHAAAEARRDEIRVFVIFWDEYHISQFEPTLRAQNALADLVRNAFGPTDLVAIVDQLTPTDAIRFTRDRTELADQVRKLKGRFGIYIPARSAMEEAQLYRGQGIELIRSQVTASALESTIAYLGALKEGRKTILFVSQTVGRLGGAAFDPENWVQKTIQLANSNNTTIYTLDPRGLNVNVRPSFILQSLAENTGGKQFSSNFPAASLREIVRNASAYYLLGYASSQNPVDGKFHQIKVNVKRPGVEVKARTGYTAPSLAEVDTAAKKAAEAQPPSEIAKALGTIVDAPHMPASGDLWAGAAPGAGGSARVTVAWTPRATSAAALKPPGEFTLSATDPNGRVLFDGALPSGRVTFDAPPGKLQLRGRTLDADGAAGDRQDLTLDVPDFAAAPLTLTSPVLLRARTPRELRELLAAADPPPCAGRQFDRTDRILVRFSVAGSDTAGATVTATLLNRRGAKLSTLPLTSRAGDFYQLDLSMTSIARGEYVIEIEAAKGANHAKALVPIRVGEP